MSASDSPRTQLSRLATEFSVSGIEELIKLTPGRYAEGLSLIAIARVCVADWFNGKLFKKPEQPELAISIRRLAATMNFSVETTRRHVLFLSSLGLVQKCSDGVQLATDSHRNGEICSLLCKYHDLAIRLFEEVSHTTEINWPRPDYRPLSTLTITQLSLDHALRPLSIWNSITGNWTMMILWIVIGALNIRGVTYDPILARRYGHSPSPDSLRHPVPLLPVATHLVLPYSSAWRYTEHLKELGLIERKHGGLVVLTSNLHSGLVPDAVQKAVIAIERMCRHIALGGASPMNAAQHYLIGRPSLLEISLAIQNETPRLFPA